MTAEAITFGRGKAPRVLAKSFTPRLRVQTPKRLQLLVCILGRGNNCIISYPQLWPEEGHAPMEATFLPRLPVRAPRLWLYAPKLCLIKSFAILEFGMNYHYLAEDLRSSNGCKPQPHLHRKTYNG